MESSFVTVDCGHQPRADTETPLRRASFLGDSSAGKTYSSSHTIAAAIDSHRPEVNIMLIATPKEYPDKAKSESPRIDRQDIVETRLWLEEHDWLYGLLRSDKNVSPTFRFPDLISSCISLVFTRQDASACIFQFLGTELILRSPQTPRRRESMWRQQYQLLLDLQRSPANRHPNPKFQLDQLTTACVALCRTADASGTAILRQARRNMAERAHHGWDAPPG